MLVHLDHVASFIVNANHSIRAFSAMYRLNYVFDCVANRRYGETDQSDTTQENKFFLLTKTRYRYSYHAFNVREGGRSGSWKRCCQQESDHVPGGSNLVDDHPPHLFLRRGQGELKQLTVGVDSVGNQAGARCIWLRSQ